MSFQSLAFAVFLPLVFALHWLLPHKFRWAALLLASYIFYLSWDVRYVLFLLASTLVTYGTVPAGRMFSGAASTARDRSRKMPCISSPVKRKTALSGCCGHYPCSSLCRRKESLPLSALFTKKHGNREDGV